MKRLFRSLPETPELADAFQAFPTHIAPLLAYQRTLLRDLSVEEWGLVSAKVPEY